MTHFIVDGYNVLAQHDGFSGGSLRDRREKLLRWIEDRCPQGRRPITVVFDGRSDVSAPRWPGPTKTIFSAGSEADQVIKNLVDRSSRPSDIVVVTDDRAIQRWVRGAGAAVMSAGNFLASGATPRPPRASGRLDLSAVESINREVWDLWMRK